MQGKRTQSGNILIEYLLLGLILMVSLVWLGRQSSYTQMLESLKKRQLQLVNILASPKP